jgi:hypothetical protein
MGKRLYLIFLSMLKQSWRKNGKMQNKHDKTGHGTPEDWEQARLMDCTKYVGGAQRHVSRSREAGAPGGIKATAMPLASQSLYLPLPLHQPIWFCWPTINAKALCTSHSPCACSHDSFLIIRSSLASHTIDLLLWSSWSLGHLHIL